SRRFLHATAQYDVLLAPVCTMTARPVGWFDADGDGAGDFERQKRYAAFTALFNVTGQPAVSVPLYWTASGLPIGSMLVGRPADEATLLARSAPGGGGHAARRARAGGARPPVGAPAPRRMGLRPLIRGRAGRLSAVT